MDLTSVQARCQHQISAASCYQRYREMGINYGPALQGIEQLSVGEDEVLARLRLPVEVVLRRPRTQTDFVLHPSLLDAALQTCIGLMGEQNAYQGPYLPFTLEALSIVGTIPAQGWAWVRRRRIGTGASPVRVPTPVFDIEVCDDAGHVALSLRGLTTRPLSTRSEETRTLLLTPAWKEEAIAGQEQALSAVGEGTEAVGTGLAPSRRGIWESVGAVACPCPGSLSTPPHGQGQATAPTEYPSSFSKYLPLKAGLAPVPTAPSLVLLCHLPGILASRIQAQLAEGGRCCSLTSSQVHRE